MAQRRLMQSSTSWMGAIVTVPQGVPSIEEKVASGAAKKASPLQAPLGSRASVLAQAQRSAVSSAWYRDSLCPFRAHQARNDTVKGITPFSLLQRR